MLKINKKMASISVICILTIAFAAVLATTSAASSSGTDLSVLNIVKDIQQKINTLIANTAGGSDVQVVSYSGSYNIKAEDILLNGRHTIADVKVYGPGGEDDRSVAADFKISLLTYVNGGYQRDLTETVDYLIIGGTAGNPLPMGFDKVSLNDEDISYIVSEASFTGNSLSIYISTLGGEVPYDVTIYYSYTITTVPEAVITQSIFEKPI